VIIMMMRSTSHDVDEGSDVDVGFDSAAATQLHYDIVTTPTRSENS